MTNLASTAPHIHDAKTYPDLADWGVQPDAIEGVSKSDGRLLFKGPGNRPELGLWVCTPGRWRLRFPADEVVYILSGAATYRRDSGEVIEARPDTLIHFKEGFAGEATVHETLRLTYMLSEGGPRDTTPVLTDCLTRPAAADWGVIPTMIDGASNTSGVLLSREPDRRAESGIWICTPGLWRCEVTGDEYCHFLAGRSTYVHDDGDVIEIHPDTVAYFPKGWTGTCRVHETIRKVYMIR